MPSILVASIRRMRCFLFKNVSERRQFQTTYELCQSLKEWIERNTPPTVGESHMGFGGGCESICYEFFECLPTMKGDRNAKVQPPVPTAQRPSGRQHPPRSAGDPLHRPGGDLGGRHGVHGFRAGCPGTGGCAA